MDTKLPHAWLPTLLNDVSEIVTGKTPSTKDPRNFGGGIPFIKPADLDKGRYITQTVETLTDLGATSVPTVPANSIPVTCIGNLGKVGITNQISATNQQINTVLTSSLVDYRFFYYQLKTLKPWMQENASATTVTIINKAKFSKAPVQLPPLAEQKAIADKLDTLLAQVETTQTRLERIPQILKRFRQSVLAAAVSGKLTEEWRQQFQGATASDELDELIAKRQSRLRQLGKIGSPLKRQTNQASLPRLPGTWTYSFIDPFLDVERQGMKTGPFGSLLKKDEHKAEGIPVLGIENIKSGRFMPGSKINITCEKAEDLKAYDICPNDLILSRSGTVGDICMVPEGTGTARFSTNIMRVSLYDGYLNPRFFVMLFLGSPMVLEQVSELCKGSTRLFLNQKILSSIKYPVPPKNEQTEIVRRVDELFAHADRIEQQVNNARARVNNFTQSILAKAFTGELTEQWRKDNPELISGENSAEALLERIQAERAAAAGKKKPRKVVKKVLDGD